jgi:hypothetical protein
MYHARIFAGGYSYSQGSYNPWPWLTSRSAAEDMAAQVAQWPSKYGCDGIDLDIETGAGDTAEAGPNLVAFVARLKALRPDIHVSQPVFGYPQVSRGLFLTSPLGANFDPQGRSCPPGVNLSPRGEVLPWG